MKNNVDDHFVKMGTQGKTTTTVAECVLYKFSLNECNKKIKNRSCWQN